MPSHPDLAAIISRITAERAKALMVELARVPSPQTELLEAEPKLRAFIDTAVEPRLRAMGITDIIRDRMGNLAASCGHDTSGRSLMFVTNAMNQPASTMPNPYGGEIRDGTPYGLPGEVVLGKGLSEQKAPLAAILLAVESILASRIDVTGRIVFVCCVSGETGRHDAIRTLIEESGVRAEMALLNGTGNRISLGNRGRVDVVVTVHGSPCHSSRPASGCNAITGAVEVIRRLSEGLTFTASHPDLGGPTLAINHIRSFPDSTHTIQDRCEISLDAACCRRRPRCRGGGDRRLGAIGRRRARSRKRQALAGRDPQGCVHVSLARRDRLKAGPRCHPGVRAGARRHATDLLRLERL